MTKSPKTGREWEDFHIRNGPRFLSRFARRLAGVSVDPVDATESDAAED